MVLPATLADRGRIGGDAASDQQQEKIEDGLALLRVVGKVIPGVIKRQRLGVDVQVFSHAVYPLRTFAELRTIAPHAY